MPPDIHDLDEGRRLHIAAREGDVEHLNRLLKAGENVNGTNGDGDTPLHLAVWKQSKPAIRLLLLSGSSISKRDARQKSPLEQAKQWGGHELVAFLEKVLEEYHTLQLALRHHALTGEWNELNRTLEYSCLINIYLPEGHTLLHEAVQSGSFKAIQQLLEHGANIEAQDEDGRTAVHRAAELNSLKAIRHLIGHNTLQAQDNDGWKALHLAAQSGSSKAIQQLLGSGANVQARDKGERKALRLAAQSDFSIEAIRELLDHGADIQAVDKNGQTALHLAAQSGSPKAIQQLLDHGADIQAQDKGGRTALHLAAQSDISIEAIQQLLNYGTGVQAQEKGGWTAETVARNRESEIVNSTDNDGQTILHLAAEGGHASVVELLVNLSSDVSVNLADNKGKTPLHRAAEAGRSSVVELLLDKRAIASVNLADIDGKTPLNLAKEAGHESVVKLLMDLGSEESLSLDDIIVERPPNPSSDNTIPLINVSISEVISILRDLMISSLRNAIMDAFHSIWSLFLPSELPPHVSRIQWTGHCGHRSHDDFISEQKVVKTIADRMISSGIKAEIVTHRESRISALLSELTNMALSGYRRCSGTQRASNQSATGNLQASAGLSAAACGLSQGVRNDTQRYFRSGT
jgi:ankyrin repeat protein